MEANYGKIATALLITFVVGAFILLSSSTQPPSPEHARTFLREGVEKRLLERSKTYSVIEYTWENHCAIVAIHPWGVSSSPCSPNTIRYEQID